MADDVALSLDEDAEALVADKVLADENWQRYEYVRDRGHIKYCQEARRLEDYVLGGGRQWSQEDKEVLQEQGRMPLEFNEILPAIKAAAGYQIANRMDIAFQPRGGLATQDIATVLSKVAMQVADNVELHWKETDVFLDGMIQRRGFFDIRIDFDDSMRGEIRIEVLDPLDVLPDPDAKSYDPDHWSDVQVTRWLTLDEIEQRYGPEARAKAENGTGSIGAGPTGDADFGDSEEQGEGRNKFGDETSGNFGVWDAQRRDKHLTRLRIIDRQKFVLQLVQVVVSPDTGDVRVVEDMEPERLTQVLARGGILTRRMARRVKWTVTTFDAVLHDDWSPYPFLTVVPYFPFFRRGKSIGMVDNAIGPQDALNKAVSQYIHIINTTANSGWVVEQDSLSNMTTDSLADVGAKTGLVVEYKKGRQKPEKIQPAQIPAGLDRIIDRLTVVLKENTVPDAARGIDDENISGVSRQSKQFAAQKQLAVEIDNLGRTRKLLARRMLWLLQNYYDEQRIFRITKHNPQTGMPQTEELIVNQADDATGDILNDLTLGEYDVVISDAPTNVTFENGQFEQAMDMRKEGIRIPDDVVVRNSNLSDKTEVIRRMAEQQEQADPLVEAEVALKKAQTQKTQTEKVAKAVEAQFSAIQTAQTIAATPATAPLADALLLSAGFIDADAAPIVPTAPEGIAALPMPQNTNPLTPLNPASPAVGVNQGIEGGQ